MELGYFNKSRMVPGTIYNDFETCKQHYMSLDGTYWVRDMIDIGKSIFSEWRIDDD